MRKVTYAGGVFGRLHQAMLAVEVDFAAFDPSRHPPELLALARQVWPTRVQSEFRSIQIMARFLGEIVNAGDPLDVYAGAVDLVADEVRHTALCASLCQALGGPAPLPEPVELRDPPGFVQASAGERALHTALTMLVVSETISTAYVRDLLERCGDPVVRQVLAATVADEQTHGDFGWAYVQAALTRFPATTRPAWRHLVHTTLAPHIETATQALASVPPALGLDALPEPQHASLGLFTPARQALVFRNVLDQELRPRLVALDLW